MILEVFPNIRDSTMPWSVLVIITLLSISCGLETEGRMPQWFMIIMINPNLSNLSPINKNIRSRFCITSSECLPVITGFYMLTGMSSYKNAQKMTWNSQNIDLNKEYGILPKILFSIRISLFCSEIYSLWNLTLKDLTSARK